MKYAPRLQGVFLVWAVIGYLADQMLRQNR